MLYQFEPTRPLGDEARRVALECVDDAVARLGGLDDQTGADIESAIHEVRKRCKELRGLARLVRSELGDDYQAINASVRDVARELSPIRDAQAQLHTIEAIQDSVGAKKAHQLDTIRDRQIVATTAVTNALRADDPRIERARVGLHGARAIVEAWSIPDDIASIERDLDATYRRGRSALKQAKKQPSDERVHEWRKAVKYLWYQTRLLAGGDPDALVPLTQDLDDLSDLLGDDHDLAVLVQQLGDTHEAPPLDHKTVRRAVAMARDRQADLRSQAIDLGTQVYAPAPSEMVKRFAAPWGAAIDTRRADEHAATTMERERTFLVTSLPDLPEAGVRIRQGYLALDGDVQLRVRDAGSSARTLTLKGGSGAVRTEIEWKIGRDRFDALWPLARGRSVDKTRYRIPVDGGVAELDLFEGTLTGLVLVEVEFESNEAMDAFEPPDWFGREVTDDPRYGNASLAVDGLDNTLFR